MMVAKLMIHYWGSGAAFEDCYARRQMAYTAGNTPNVRRA